MPFLPTRRRKTKKTHKARRGKRKGRKRGSSNFQVNNESIINLLDLSYAYINFLDDEDEEVEEEEEEEEAAESEVEGEEADFSLVDYDSEENEVVISNQPGPKKSKATNFFEAEAELSGSDWESADEDERGLDDFEEELGDKEQFDEDNVKEELGKIHA